MGVDTEIAWCDHTFNPWWGCQRVSPGCEHCYAESFAKRVGHGKRLPMIWGPASTTERKFFGDAHWAEPLKWNAKAARDGVRRRVFCASMADVFEDQEGLVQPRNRLFRLITDTPNLDWLLLTKRPQNADRLWTHAWNIAGGRMVWDGASTTPWLPNIWLGTTVEDQKRADERIPELLKVPARLRFLSCEPLLESVELRDIPCNVPRIDGSRSFDDYFDSLSGRGIGLGGPDAEATEGLYPHIDWVIVGGESGPGARPFDLAWARSLRDQCKAAGVACFLKQMGSRPKWDPNLAEDWWHEGHVGADGHPRFADRKGGAWEEWPGDLRVREWPAVAP